MFPKFYNMGHSLMFAKCQIFADSSIREMFFALEVLYSLHLRLFMSTFIHNLTVYE